MINQRYHTNLLTVVLLLLTALCCDSSGAEPVDFRKDVAPILQHRCLRCHNDRDQRGGLSLQSAKTVAKGGDSGKVIIPGDPESSYLLDLVTPSDGSAEMPKEESPIKKNEVATVRRWIMSGAT